VEIFWAGDYEREIVQPTLVLDALVWSGDHKEEI